MAVRKHLKQMLARYENYYVIDHIGSQIGLLFVFQPFSLNYAVAVPEICAKPRTNLLICET